jgi:hypothetical protein
LDGREDGDVGFSVQVQETSLASSLVNGVQAVCETMHSAGVNIFVELMSLAGPGTCKCITKWLYLRDQVGMRDLERPSCADFRKLFRVELLVIMVGRALALELVHVLKGGFEEGSYLS